MVAKYRITQCEEKNALSAPITANSYDEALEIFAQRAGYCGILEFEECTGIRSNDLCVTISGLDIFPRVESPTDYHTVTLYLSPSGVKTLVERGALGHGGTSGYVGIARNAEDVVRESRLQARKMLTDRGRELRKVQEDIRLLSAYLGEES